VRVCVRASARTGGPHLVQERLALLNVPHHRLELLVHATASASAAAAAAVRRRIVLPPPPQIKKSTQKMARVRARMRALKP
jgi:hypothetical protein